MYNIILFAIYNIILSAKHLFLDVFLKLLPQKLL